tara:strand:+ start:1685 stop:1822 length:138 start_codon:yes stop_codon:yes gene_type:complete
MPTVKTKKGEKKFPYTTKGKAAAAKAANKAKKKKTSKKKGNSYGY